MEDCQESLKKSQRREMTFADCSDYQSIITALMVLAPSRKVRQHSRSDKKNVYIHASFFFWLCNYLSRLACMRYLNVRTKLTETLIILFSSINIYTIKTI